MMALWEAFEIKAARYWFVLSTLAIAILAYMVDRRNRQLTQIHLDEQTAALAEKLAAVKEQSQRSMTDYEQASDDYARLRAIHGPLLDKLGISLTNTAPSPNKPYSPRN